MNESKNLNLVVKDKDEIFKESNKCISEYKIKSLNKDEVYIYFRNCFFFTYFNLMIKYCEYDKIDNYFELLDNIHKYDSYTKIILLSQYLNIIKYYKHFPKLININDLDKINLYYLALELQKEIIKNMNEKSNIFYPILQFNSKVLKILPDDCFNLVKEKIKKLLKVNNYQNYAYTISL